MVRVGNCCLSGCWCPGLVSVEDDVDIVARVRLHEVPYQVVVVVNPDVVVLFRVSLDRGAFLDGVVDPLVYMYAEVVSAAMVEVVMVPVGGNQVQADMPFPGVVVGVADDV